MENASATAKGRTASVATGASQAAQQQTGQAYSNLIGLVGYKGTIESPAQAGLSAIGQTGADYLGTLTTTPKTTTTTTPSTLEGFRLGSKEYDPYEELYKYFANR